MWYFMSEEEKRIAETARVLAKEIAASADAHDKTHTNKANMESIRKLQAKKMLALHVPKEFGGEGTNFVAWCLAQEEICKVDVGVGNCISHEAVGSNIMAKLANKEQGAKYLKQQVAGALWGILVTEPQGGSDMADFRTTAVKKGDKYIINGHKAWGLNADVADYQMVWCSTNPELKLKGLSIIIVPKGTKGLTVRPGYNKPGWAGISCCPVDFENVEVPITNIVGQEGDGMKAFLLGLNPGRVGIAAQALGLAEGAYEYAMNYLNNRVEFGAPLTQLQGIRFRLADMATAIEASRALVYTTARLIDAKDPSADKLTAMAKQQVSDMAVKVTNDAVQIMGAAGFQGDYPIERMVRDAQGLCIADGANDVMRVIVSGMILPRPPKK